MIRRRSAAHAATRRPGSTGTTQRPTARRAPRRRPAGLTHQARQIPGPRHLHQHRPRPQPLTGDLESAMRQPRRPSRRIAGQVRVRLPRDVHRRSRCPDHRPIRDQLVGVPRLHQRGRLRRTREPTEQHRTLLPESPEQQDFPRMRVRRPRLGVRVVAVVPQRDQPELRHRRERGRPRPDHHPRTPAQRREEGPVASRRPEVRGQRDEPRLPEHRRTGRCQPLEVTRVRHEQQRAPTGRRTHRRRLRERERPIGPRYGGPDRAR